MKLRQKLFAVTGALTVALGVGFLVTPEEGSAHGVSMFPGSRTYLCYQDGHRDNGSIDPYNPACADAVAQSGTTPLYNWYSVLDSNADGRGEGYIPDGTLCSAGNNSPYDFSAYNMARTDWPVTHLTSGASYEMHYSNWAHHPGTFRIYITRDGWDPNQPLGWGDLRQIDTVTDPPQSGGPGGDNYYYWDLQMPSGKSGRHMLFVQWVRSDSPENFFSCSDIVFDGGNGEVTGIGPDQDDPTDPPDDPTDPPEEPASCEVDYQVANEWNSGFTANVTVTNTGDQALDGWDLTWSFADGQEVTNAWNADVSQSGADVTAAGSGHTSEIGAGESVNFGFQASHDGSNTVPDAFALNASDCAVAS